ncbi:MAG: hypothetical protein IIC78_12090 [Chloroflexi bacterium]|nr:hypothetical protein [Chloroflexota bacterium]
MKSESIALCMAVIKTYLAMGGTGDAENVSVRTLVSHVQGTSHSENDEPAHQDDKMMLIKVNVILSKNVSLGESSQRRISFAK